MRLYCLACEQRLAGPDELCNHRNPVGWCCCDDEHQPGDEADGAA